MHDGVPAGVSELGVAPLGAAVPGLDLAGPGEPLYAHVRDAADEWGRHREPQEGGGGEELGVEYLLYE